MKKRPVEMLEHAPTRALGLRVRQGQRIILRSNDGNETMLQSGDRLIVPLDDETAHFYGMEEARKDALYKVVDVEF